jgi:hypothetical protein
MTFLYVCHLPTAWPSLSTELTPVACIPGAAKISDILTLPQGKKSRGPQAVAMLSHFAIPRANETYVTVWVIDEIMYLYGVLFQKNFWVLLAALSMSVQLHRQLQATRQETRHAYALVSQSTLHC